jgi:hypothetical protein
MKTQMAHSTPTTLRPFLRLIRQMTTQYQTEEVAAGPQALTNRPPDSRGIAGSDDGEAPRTSQYLFARAPTLGPFLTLLFTLHAPAQLAIRPRLLKLLRIKSYASEENFEQEIGWP